MSLERSLVIYFRPGLPPAKRHAIDDELEAALGERGEVTGGGTMLDMSESDTSLIVADVMEAVPILRDTLRRLRVPRGTVIVQFEPEERQWPVFDEPAAPKTEKKPKWKD